MKPTSEIAVSKIQRGEKMYCKGFADLRMNRLMFYHCEYARQKKSKRWRAQSVNQLLYVGIMDMKLKAV